MIHIFICEGESVAKIFSLISFLNRFMVSVFRSKTETIIIFCSTLQSKGTSAMLMVVKSSVVGPGGRESARISLLRILPYKSKCESFGTLLPSSAVQV